MMDHDSNKRPLVAISLLLSHR